MHRTLSYADALHAFTDRLVALTAAGPAVPLPRLYPLLTQVCRAGRDEGISRVTTAEQTRSAVLFLRAAHLGPAERRAIAEDAVAVVLATYTDDVPAQPGGPHGDGRVP